MQCCESAERDATRLEGRAPTHAPTPLDTAGASSSLRDGGAAGCPRRRSQQPPASGAQSGRPTQRPRRE
eukprot:scaffold65831_cov78-Phaeocystis_antarctica.AAC.4